MIFKFLQNGNVQNNVFGVQNNVFGVQNNVFGVHNNFSGVQYSDPSDSTSVRRWYRKSRREAI